MMDAARLRTQIQVHEGCSLKPYADTEGVLTIGYGRNLNEGISDDEAEVMLSNDITKAVLTAHRVVGSVTFEGLSDERQEVLVNMAFNLGETRMKKFVHMLAALTVEDYERVAAEMLDSKWARQVGARAVQLSEIMRKGAH